MTAADEIKKEMKALLAQEHALLALLDKMESMRIVNFGTMYQGWYTRAMKLVASIAAERLEEFVSYYRADARRKTLQISNYVIQDYINGFSPVADASGTPPYDALNLTRIRFVNQVQILQSIESRIGAVLSDVRGALLAELEDGELEAARQLLVVSLRAAGALAGVVLERHLQRVAENHAIVLKKKEPTISDLNNPLKEKGVIAIPVWRKIQYLADIRNLCSHKKTADPTEGQVVDLIDGVNSIVKTVH
jgi:hypothetical protein